MDVTVDLGPIVEGLAVGDSVALSGCCVTVTRISGAEADFHMVRETLARTWFGCLAPGTEVNLERALLATARLGGHFVQGHVDGVGRIVTRETRGNSIWYTLKIPDVLIPYAIEKGSIALDGISLTIARLTDSLCAVSIIPHTASITTFGDKKTGDEVNIEVDMIGRYVESLLQAGRIRAPDEKTGKSPITESWLKERL